MEVEGLSIEIGVVGEDEVVEDVVANDGEEAVKEQGAIGAEHPNIRDELADDSVMDCSES